MSSNTRDHLSFLDKYSIQHKASGSDQTLLRDKQTGGYVLMKEVSVETAEQFKVVIDTLESQRCLRHQHLLSLTDYEIRPEQSKQGVTRKVITFFEYSCHNLQDEIQARLRENRPFDQTQLWSLLCSPTLGLAYLQRQNIGHGCVSPIDIFLTPQGTIKIADPSIATSSPLDCVQGYYYSPQMLNGQHDVDVFKSDVFSLAMCAIHAGLLQPCDDCYDYSNGNFSFQTLQQKINRLAESYSQQFIEVLLLMLNVQVSQRPSFLQLEEHLVEMLNPNESMNASSSSMGKSGVTNRESVPRPQGIKSMREEIDEERSMAEQEMQLGVDAESQPDKNQDREEQEEPTGMVEVSREILRVESQRVIEVRQEEQQPNTLLTRSSVRRPYQQPGSTFRATEIRITTDSRLNPQCITTSKYDQENVRDFLNLNLPNKTSIILEQKPKSSYIDSRYTQGIGGRFSSGLSNYAQNTTTINTGYGAPNFDKKPTGYGEWNGYSYKPTDDQLFTDPKLLMMMKSDLMRIQSRQQSNYGL